MNAIELLNKPGLWLLAGLAPLVLLYILKIKRERVRVPSIWLWSAAKRDLMAVLTPEQQTKLKTLRHASRHHERTPAQPERSQQSDLEGQESATSAS